MTEHDEIPSVDDSALEFSSNGRDPSEGEGGASAPPPLPQPNRVQRLIRDKQTADAIAARSVAEAAALRHSEPVGQPKDYRLPEDYTRAVAHQAAREAGAEILTRQATQAQEFAARAAQEAWVETTSAFRQKVPDFDAVAHNPNLTVTPIMADAIRESGMGAEIAYYLGKNPAEANRIANLPPVSQATAIARLETRLGTSAPSVSRAPQPVATLSGRSGGAGRSLEDMPFEDYRRARGY